MSENTFIPLTGQLLQYESTTYYKHDSTLPNQSLLVPRLTLSKNFSTIFHSCLSNAHAKTNTPNKQLTDKQIDTKQKTCLAHSRQCNKGSRKWDSEPEGTWRSPLCCPGTAALWGWLGQCISSFVPEHRTWHDRVPGRRAVAKLHINHHHVCFN